MNVTITFQPVAVAAVALAGDEAGTAAAPRQANGVAPQASSVEGRLLFVDGNLGAVLARIEDEFEEERLRGAWFLEATFGILADERNRIFSTLSDAAAWAEQRAASAPALQRASRWPRSGPG